MGGSQIGQPNATHRDCLKKKKNTKNQPANQISYPGLTIAYRQDQHTWPHKQDNLCEGCPRGYTAWQPYIKEMNQ